MFPDSEVAKKLQLYKTKCLYFINHDISPYYKAMLLSTLHHFFSIFWRIAEQCYAEGTNVCANQVLERKNADIKNSLFRF